MITLHTVITWLTTPNLAWTFCCTADPVAWEGLFTCIDFRRVVGADFEVGSQRYGGFAHDWQAEPLSVWRQVMDKRQLDLEFKPEPLVQAVPPLLALSQPEFADAVRQALHDYHRPETLACNPLLRSRVLRESASPNPGPEDLQTLLCNAADALTATLKYAKLHRALYHTYVQPASPRKPPPNCWICSSAPAGIT